MKNYRTASFLRVTIVLCIIILGGAGCSNSLFVESKDITSGEIGHFKIGMDKLQVLKVAQKEHVHAIRPILNLSPSITYDNVNLLAIPRNGRAFQLTGKHALKVIYSFDECKVSGVQILAGANKSWTRFIGKSSAEFIRYLKKALEANHALSVNEVVNSANHEWFKLDSPPEKKVSESIMAYDIWSFDVGTAKPAGSEFVIYFSEGSVVRISYKRPRIRVE